MFVKLSNLQIEILELSPEGSLLSRQTVAIGDIYRKTFNVSTPNGRHAPPDSRGQLHLRAASSAVAARRFA